MKRSWFTFQNIALALVVGLTAWAAFQSAQASNNATQAVSRVDNQQIVSDRVQSCTNTFLFGLLKAVNERTSFTIDQAQANIDLQTSQLPLIEAIIDPSMSGVRAQEIVKNYADKLREFVRLSTSTTVTQKNAPYPTETAYLECITNARGTPPDHPLNGPGATEEESKESR